MGTLRRKIVDQNELKKILKRIRDIGERIAFTNGCFDILHVGHVRYLSRARSFGDVLVVGLNSDDSVKKIKGEERPINFEKHRAEVLAAMECVNYVTIFSDPTPLKLIKMVKPDVLVKGSDWEENEIVGSDVVKRNGGKIVRVPIVPCMSTSKLIERIQRGI